MLLILSLPLVLYFLLPLDAGTAAYSDHSCRWLQPVGEVGHADTKGDWVVGVVGTRAPHGQRTHDMIVGEGDVGAVLRIECDLEEIRQIAVGASSQRFTSSM